MMKSLLFCLCCLELGMRASSAAVVNVTSKSTMNDEEDAIICYCEECPLGKDEFINYCILRPGGQCFSAVEEVYNKEKQIFESQRSFGCISENEHALLQCKGDLVPSYYGRSIQCCNFTDFCNRDLLPLYPPHEPPPSSNTMLSRRLFIIILLAVLVLTLCIIIVSRLFRKWYDDVETSKCFAKRRYGQKLQKSQHILQDSISTTGSGVGKPLLVQTTISRQFKAYRPLGRGQFPMVYVGNWNASKIVEKRFTLNTEDRWKCEKNVYEIASLRHDNVLGYIASDTSRGFRAIYTDYHPIGSLYNYLNDVRLTERDFLKLVRSAVKGIHYLHTETLGTEKRPAVAHRNITSKNFLINGNKECVISNFEIAIMHMSTEDELRDEPDLEVGTPRYMAPEVLNKTIEGTFESFKKADIYSLGLVFYEICRRCVGQEGSDSKCEDRELPFWHVLPQYPSLMNMRELHSTTKPKEELLCIPTRWEDDKFLNSFVFILRECLYEYPKSRPSALGILKRIPEPDELMPESWP